MDAALANAKKVYVEKQESYLIKAKNKRVEIKMNSGIAKNISSKKDFSIKEEDIEYK